MTASCLLAGFLRKKGLDCEIYIPRRIDEGYGVNNNAVDDFARRGVSLVITVDCGVTANIEAAHAAELGIDMIITDHHECRDELPEAVAVIDPKRRDCTYVNKSLAGVGVAFKLVCAVEGQDKLAELLDEYGHGFTEPGLKERGYVNHTVKVNYGEDSIEAGTFKKVGSTVRYRILMNFSNLSFYTIFFISIFYCNICI